MPRPVHEIAGRDLPCRCTLRIGSVAPLALACVVAAPTLARAAPRPQNGTSIVSLGAAGAPGNGPSVAGTSRAISADGRLVAFTSSATDLVPNDLNGVADVFVRDRLAGTTLRASVASSGAEAGGASSQATISGNGRFVAFASVASDLVPGDGNARSDVFVHDLQSGVTERVSVATSGAEGDGDSEAPAISDDGRWVAFTSQATNLVPGDSNQFHDVFVRDRLSGVTRRVSVDSLGAQADGVSRCSSISGDGRNVGFFSNAGNLAPGDHNWAPDAFAHDLLTGATVRLSVDSAGEEGSGASFLPVLSWDGRFAAFFSYAPNLVPGDTNDVLDVFVRDTRAGTTTRASVSSAGVGGDQPSYLPSLSGDGRYVAFVSGSSNLVPGPTTVNGIYVHDRLLGLTSRASLDSLGNEGGASTHGPSISADGRHVVFGSDLPLVPGDGNGALDVFVHDRAAPYVTYCTAKASSNSCVASVAAVGSPSIAAGGFAATAAPLEGAVLGVFLYSASGPAFQPVQAGFVCVQPPVARLAAQTSGGASGSCRGAFTTDLSSVLTAVGVGNPVWGQYWYRDPGAAGGAALSDALTFSVWP